MSSVKQFQELLNKGDSQRFINWTSYRREMSNHIIEIIKNSNINSCIILGAGNSDDIDLSAIQKYTNKITLTDIDLVALKRSEKKYNLTPNKCSILPIDYLGLDFNDNWNNFVINIVKFNRKDQIEPYLNSIKMAAMNYHFKLAEMYDLVIVSPIYTQLFLNQGLSYLSILNNLNFDEELLQYIQDNLLNSMSEIINRFNDDLIACASKDAIIIVMSDIFETNLDSDFYRKAKNSTSMEKFYKDYSNKYGIGLGDYGLLNLDEKISKKSTKWFEWPFSRTRRMFVKVNEYKK